MSKAIIIRLSKYKNIIKRFKKLGFVKVFSDNIAEAIGGTSSQVRKDFSLFGISGNKRGGYIIENLLDKLNEILGKDCLQEAIVVGVGHIGGALITYKGFENENIKISAGFDIDPKKYEHKYVKDFKVYHIDQLRSFVQKNNIKLGIIAVPDVAAQQILDVMISAGIIGVLNFAPILLRGNDSVVINNVNLELELENIIYFINAKKKQMPNV
jgi:redox-sensing transcriptional repressor